MIKKKVNSHYKYTCAFLEIHVLIILNTVSHNHISIFKHIKNCFLCKIVIDFLFIGSKHMFLVSTTCFGREIRISIGPRRDKTCLQGFVNNKGADQPAHTHRLISAFVIRLLESFISKHASREILIF